MPKNKVRIGFVGVGSMGQCAHLKNYVTIPDCQVVAIAELRRDTAKKVAARYAIPRIYTDHREMLSREQLDGIVASQPFNRHGILIPALMKAGVPVFVEKPLAGSVPVGGKIAEAVKAGGTFLMVGYHKRSDPATMYAKEAIDRLKLSGELGKLKYIRILMPAGDYIANGFVDLVKGNDAQPNLKTDPLPPDMSEKTYREYLSFVNYYIHQVNLMRHLLGEPYSVRYADQSGVLLVGESTSGIPCLIEMSPYETTIDWQETALVCFEHGWIKLSLPAPLAINRAGRVEVFKDPGKSATPQIIVPQLPWISAMRQQAINFIRAIKREIPPMTTAEEALLDLQVAKDYLSLRQL
ncbi:MAG: Gfo/Idh/MocA family oxidoreductase [Candidatus Omnitrophota bacterium]